MANTNFRSVDEYIASQPEPAQAVLQRVRGALRKALPRAEEVISYQMPAYKLDGRIVLYFGGWKQHFSLYPVTDQLVEAFGDVLAPYGLSHKGTIRFTLSEPVPVRLIERIAKFRAKECAAAAAAKKRPRSGAGPVRRIPKKRSGVERPRRAPSVR